MTRHLPALVAAATLVAGLALAQGSMSGMDHSKMAGTTTTSTSAMPGMNMSMNMGGLDKLQGKAFDRAFLSMMVPHHQAAVDMSRAVLPVGKDATVRAWANTIIKDQNREIAEMNTLLKGYGGSDAAMANTMKGNMGGMADAIKKAKNPDVAFVQGMLSHHASAIDMAQLALQKSGDARVLGLARDIVRAQASEMHDFRTWLNKRGA